MRQPVSIVITSHEHFDYTRKAVLSILLCDSTKNDEIIIVDDGSSPATREGLYGLTRNVEREIRVLDLPGIGHPALARSRQTGGEHSRYDWVLWMDNDTEWRFGDPVERLQEVWKEIPDLGAIQPQRVNHKGTVYGACRHKANLEYDGSDTEGIAFGMYPEGACWMSHKSTFEKWEFDTRLAGFEDSDIGYQLYQAGLKVVCVNDVRVYHHQWVSGAWNYVHRHPETRTRVIEKWSHLNSERFKT